MGFFSIEVSFKLAKYIFNSNAFNLELLIYIINSEIVFVVCLSRTIFGKKKSAHVHLEGWKHGNKDTDLNMACTQ